jgi:hypothetical protein
MYNFVKFCGKLVTGVKYVGSCAISYVRHRQGYIRIDDNAESEYFIPDNSPKKTFIERGWGVVKNSYYKLYKYTTGKIHPQSTQPVVLPMYESTRLRKSYFNNNTQVTEQDHIMESKFVNQIIEPKEIIQDQTIQNSSIEQELNIPQYNSAMLMESKFINQALFGQTFPFAKADTCLTLPQSPEDSVYVDTKSSFEHTE